MSVPRWVPFLGPVRRHIELSRRLLDDLRGLPNHQIEKNAESGLENDGVVPRSLRGLDVSDARSLEEVRRIKDSIHHASRCIFIFLNSFN
ncbi:hypothetical protein Moror_981 [Moniliophthora roreri MCA 2997]|uniref:Uncharacterized protein n=2 Tax=Moniliophthora roreri TaxID=221103 RepID=V2XQD4_MONRO|nr:hypothetical protein Moror_981 [Moniliophthora roreri MCA 2997]